MSTSAWTRKEKKAENYGVYSNISLVEIFRFGIHFRPSPSLARSLTSVLRYAVVGTSGLQSRTQSILCLTRKKIERKSFLIIKLKLTSI